MNTKRTRKRNCKLINYKRNKRYNLEPAMVAKQPCTTITTQLALTPAPNIIPVLTPNSRRRAGPDPRTRQGSGEEEGAARRRRPEEGRKEGRRRRKPQA